MQLSEERSGNLRMPSPNVESQRFAVSHSSSLGGSLVKTAEMFSHLGRHLRCVGCEIVGVDELDTAATQLDQASPLPDLKLAIDALSRRSDINRELLLGDM